MYLVALIHFQLDDHHPSHSTQERKIELSFSRKRTTWEGRKLYTSKSIYHSKAWNWWWFWKKLSFVARVLHLTTVLEEVVIGSSLGTIKQFEGNIQSKSIDSSLNDAKYLLTVSNERLLFIGRKLWWFWKKLRTAAL